MISSIGNNGSRSAGPIGCFVPGCKTGGKGFGRSAVKLYQAFGMCVSSKTNLTWSLTRFSLGSSPTDRVCGNIDCPFMSPRASSLNRRLSPDQARELAQPVGHPLASEPGEAAGQAQHQSAAFQLHRHLQQHAALPGDED